MNDRTSPRGSDIPVRGRDGVIPYCTDSPGTGYRTKARCARRRGDDPISWLAVSPASHEEPSIAEVFVLSNVSWEVGIKAQRCGWKEGVYMDDVAGI